MTRIENRDIDGVNNFAFHCLGAAALMMRRTYRLVRPYRRPRDFSAGDVARSVDYDFAVVAGWADLLAEYVGERFDFPKTTVLELGPGPDLGTGLILLSRGVKRYIAMDVNPLLTLTGSGFYDALLERIAAGGGACANIDALREELSAALEGAGERLRYRLSRDGDVSALGGEGIDLVLSQATLEHVADFERLAGQLAKIVSPGGIMLGVVDLQTHIRFLRRRDPLNIYRWPERFYRLVRFRGASSRLRPNQYERIMWEAGWRDVRTVPLETASRRYVESVQPHLAKPFRDADSRMEILSIALLARRAV